MNNTGQCEVRWKEGKMNVVCGEPLPCKIHGTPTPQPSGTANERLDTKDKHDSEGLEGWIKTWLPDGLDMSTLDGDSRSAKERLRVVFELALEAQKSTLKEEIMDGIANMTIDLCENSQEFKRDVINLIKSK